MSRDVLLPAVGVFAIALVARVAFAAQVVFPKPEDTAYYVGVARNLVEGRGLARHKVERAIRLSVEKYCSASAMLAQTATITHDFEVIDTAAPAVG